MSSWYEEHRPDHDYGYTAPYLKDALGDRWPAFISWISGQTCGTIHEQGTMMPVFYAEDVERFVLGLPIVD